MYSRPFCSMCILMNCCKDCNIMTLAAKSEQNSWGHLVMLMIWHYCLLLYGDCKRLLIYVVVLRMNTQWNSIRRRLGVCVLEKMVNYFKVISIWKEKSWNGLIVQGTWIIWSHRMWKRGHFYGSVNNLCAKLNGIFNNPDVASKLFYAHCCSSYGSQQWDLSNKSFDDICTAWQKSVRMIFNLPYVTHRYMLPYVVGCEHSSIDLRIFILFVLVFYTFCVYVCIWIVCLGTTWVRISCWIRLLYAVYHIPWEKIIKTTIWYVTTIYLWTQPIPITIKCKARIWRLLNWQRTKEKTHSLRSYQFG